MALAQGLSGVPAPPFQAHACQMYAAVSVAPWTGEALAARLEKEEEDEEEEKEEGAGGGGGGGRERKRKNKKNERKKKCCVRFGV